MEGIRPELSVTAPGPIFLLKTSSQPVLTGDILQASLAKHGVQGHAEQDRSRLLRKGMFTFSTLAVAARGA